MGLGNVDRQRQLKWLFSANECRYIMMWLLKGHHERRGASVYGPLIVQSRRE